MVPSLSDTNHGVNIRRYAINHDDNLCAGFAECRKCPSAGQNTFLDECGLCRPKNAQDKGVLFSSEKRQINHKIYG
jgi:hypothetical protein